VAGGVEKPRPSQPSFRRAFAGVKAGEIYPTDFQPGDECPAELIEAANEAKALG
jgi:hypothetical protein